MKTKKTLRIVRKTSLTIVEYLLLYVVIGFFISFIAVNRKAKDPNDVSIYILSNGVHTDLVLPIKTAEMDWSELVKYEHTKAKDSTAQFVAFGWGDKGFYLETPTWAELKPSVAFKAAFALSESAIHTTFYKQLQESEKCVKITVSKANYKRLVQYIQNSFDKGENNQLIHIPTTANYGNNDTFYEAEGTYSLLYTCNSWANNGLKACQQKASLWALLDEGIFYQYRNTL